MDLRAINIPQVDHPVWKDEDGSFDVKTRIGDMIYFYIESLSTLDVAPKITGMIIDGDPDELIE